MKSCLIIVLFLLLCSCSISNVSKSEHDTGIEPTKLHQNNFYGKWVGQMSSVSGLAYPFEHIEESAEVRLEIEGENIRFMINGPNGWSERYSGLFKIDAYKTNAVIYAQHSEDIYLKEGSGDWVESANFTITQKEDDSLYFFLVRSVNNYKLNSEYNDGVLKGRFFQSYTGTLFKE